MRDEKDGGPSRVLRCETRLAAALVGVKSVDFSPRYLSQSPVVVFGDKGRANMGAGVLEPVVNVCLKCQQQSIKCFFGSGFRPQIHSFGSTLVVFSLPGYDSGFEEFAETSAQSSE